MARAKGADNNPITIKTMAIKSHCRPIPVFAFSSGIRIRKVIEVLSLIDSSAGRHNPLVETSSRQPYLCFGRRATHIGLIVEKMNTGFIF
jgi:hypothetical protein